MIATVAEMWGLPEVSEEALKAYVESVTTNNPLWRGFPERSYARDVRDYTSKEPVAAYVSFARWVADCPECSSGLPCAPGFNLTICIDCGTYWKVSFPKGKDIKDAERYLEMRTDVATMNWFPDRETPRDLQVENVLHAERIV